MPDPAAITDEERNKYSALKKSINWEEEKKAKRLVQDAQEEQEEEQEEEQQHQDGTSDMEVEEEGVYNLRTRRRRTERVGLDTLGESIEPDEMPSLLNVSAITSSFTFQSDEDDNLEVIQAGEDGDSWIKYLWTEDGDSITCLLPLAGLSRKERVKKDERVRDIRTKLGVPSKSKYLF